MEIRKSCKKIKIEGNSQCIINFSLKKNVSFILSNGKNIFYVCKEQFFLQITNENISISFKKARTCSNISLTFCD